jgi:hypothetical protein
MFIYILELQENKFYVGKTNNPNFRLNRHFNSNGSVWTKKYKPIKVKDLINNCGDFDEQKYTLRCMKDYGIDNVRGGPWCEININKYKLEIEKYINSDTDKCYNCGKIGHYVMDCNSNNINIKPTLNIYQKGAGNGKTYGIWKSICENKKKTTFLLLTKQHSARVVMYKELKDQKARKEYHIKEIEGYTETHTKKHFVIKYTHRVTNKEIMVIIGTIDSFFWNVSNPSCESTDKFTSILNNVISNGGEKIDNRNIMYACQYVCLDIDCEIWIDEVQDLQREYIDAIIRLMKDTYIDVCIVGDKLQSLKYPKNSLVVSREFTDDEINIKNNSEENINRRIKVNGLSEKINSIINFKQYNLPQINIDKNTKLKECKNHFTIIDEPVIYAGDTDKTKITNYVNRIINLVKKEVDKNNYNPNNFMFIFPIMKKNVIAVELESQLNEFWIERTNNEEYKQYAYLHKHEEGSVINTNDSDYSSRIMSFQTSKGDGREVVFILRCNEKSLKVVSDGEIELLYESNLHVALTRAKKSIYFGLQKNNDDIHRRLRNIKDSNYDYIISLSNNINIDKLKDFIDKEKLIELMLNNGIDKDKLIINNDNNNESIDWKYHCIRYACFYYSIVFNIIKHFNSKGSQIYAILKTLSNLKLQQFNVNDYYEYLSANYRDNLPQFPLCVLSKKKDYKSIIDGIQDNIKNIKIKLSKMNLTDLTPLESVILIHMIQLNRQKRYADTTINDVYNVYYYLNMINENKEKNFIETLIPINKIMVNILNDIKSKDKNIKWNMEHTIKFNGNIATKLELKKNNFPVIGYGDTHSFHIIMKTNINELNFWETLIQILLERFLIYNPMNENNKSKFKDKELLTYLILLEVNDYKIIDFKWEIKNRGIIHEEIKKSLIKYFISYNQDVYEYYNNIRKTKKWKEGSSNSFEYAIKNLKNTPRYIENFFEDLMVMDKGKCKEIITDKDKFLKLLEKKIENDINLYFDDNKGNLESDDELDF